MTSKDMRKTKAQLMEELEDIRRRLAKAGKTISKLKRTEKAARENEEKYKALSDESVLGIAIFSSNPVTAVYVNPAMGEIMGYAPEELMLFSYDDMVEITHPEDRDMLWSSFADRMAGKEVPSRYEFRMLKKDGVTIWLELNAKRIQLLGEPAILTTYLDITERKKAEEKIARSEQRFRSLVEQTTDSVFCYEYDPPIPTNVSVGDQVRLMYGGILAECNDVCARSYGAAKAEEVIGKKLTDLFGTVSGSLDDFFRQFIEADYRMVDSEGVEILPDGARRYYSNNGHGIIEDGKLVRVWGTYRDITERKKAEEEIRESESRLLSLYGAVHAGVILQDADGSILHANRIACEIFGMEEDEITERTSFDPAWQMITEDGSPVPGEEHPSMITIRTGKPIRNAMRGLFAGDESKTKWLLVNTEPIFNPVTKKLQEVLITFIDITERKQVEEINKMQGDLGLKLASASGLEETLHVCLEAAIRISGLDCGGVYLVDENTGDIDLEYYLGLPAHFVKGASHYDGNSKNVQLIMKGDPIYSRHLELGVPIDESRRRERLRAIAIIPLLYERKLIGCLNVASHTKDEVPAYSRNGIESISSHIAAAIARAKIKHELQDRELMYGLVVEGANIGTWDRHIPTGRVKRNERAAQIYGYTLAEMEGNADWWESRIHPDDWPEVKEKRNRHFQGETDSFEVEYRLKHRSGEWIWAMSRGKVVERDDNGKPLRISGILLDITGRKMAEEELRKFKTISDKASYGTAIIDLEGKLVYVNDVFARMHGYEASELSDRKLSVFHTEEQMKRVNELIEVLNTKGSYSAEEVWHTRRDGDVFPALMSAGIISDDGGTPLFMAATAIDITESKRMERELQKADKLESVGILAGGIAHDFNNILTGVFGGIQLAKMSCEPGSEAHDILDDAEKASLRATDLTRQLLTFAKGGVPVKRAASIDEIIKESTGFALRGSNVRSEFSFPDDLHKIEIDVGQISQVINNLVINADQAMPDGGVITVMAENMTIGKERPHTLPHGKYVKISIRDQGAGISEEDLTKIFDPYFTTKKTGSGLGLATSYSIVKQHDGLIEVESEAGKGTVFHIHLPASQTLNIEKIEPSKKIIGGKGRILLIDDDETVIKVLTKMLKHLGYEFEYAGDGKEGVELYRKARETGDPFDAVITDLTIPGGMGGRETIKELKRIDPSVRAIVASGYSDDPIMANYNEYGFSGSVSKPFTIGKLSGALISLLEKK